VNLSSLFYFQTLNILLVKWHKVFLLDALKGTVNRMRVTRYEINVFQDKVQSNIHVPTLVQKVRNSGFGPLGSSSCSFAGF
jgi:hypothetical protein